MFSWLLTFFSEGKRVHPTGFRTVLIALLGIPLVAFEIWYGVVGTLSPLVLAIIFLGVLFTTTFLTVSITRRTDGIRFPDYALAALSVSCTVYFLFRSPEYSDWITGISLFSSWDLAAGSTMILLTLELTRRCVGPGLTVVVLIAIAYLLFGEHIGGILAHRAGNPAMAIERSIISLNGGLYSGPVQIAAAYAFLFILFGKILEHIGGGRFFFDMATAIAGKSTGGVAKVALTSSGIFGMISGSPAADVMVTGPINIPMMRRMGYSARFAAGLEAIASTGGSLIPPVMGAVVFLMVDFTGIPYRDIIISVLGVAFIYYLSIYAHVHLRSQALGITGKVAGEVPSLWVTLMKGWIYLVPFGFLVWLLMAGFSPGYVAALSVLLLIAMSWLRSEGRVGPRGFTRICVETCVSIGPLTAAIATAGLILGILNMTGVTGKISSVLFSLTGGSPLAGLFMAMVVTIILGMGMPTVAAYALAATLIAPFLVEVGIPLFQAHLFIVFYSILSAITPPVAIAAYCASSIADESPMKVALSSVSMGLGIFLLPYIFVFQPGLLMIGGSLQVVVAIASTAIGAIFLVIALEGWFEGRLSKYQRVAMLIAAAASVCSDLAISALGIISGLLLLLVRHRQGSALPEGEAALQTERRTVK